jgi:hypothetical protein
MNSEPDVRPNKFRENALLVAVGLLAHAPLWHQLPRWVQGLDPTFVHPLRIEHSPFPLVLYMAEVPSVIWVAIMVAVFIRLCRNYGWRLEK